MDILNVEVKSTEKRTMNRVSKNMPLYSKKENSKATPFIILHRFKIKIYVQK